MADSVGLNPDTVVLRPIKDANSHDGIRVNGTAKGETQVGLEALLTAGTSYQTVDLVPNATYTLTSALDTSGLSAGTIIDGHGAKIIGPASLTTALVTLKAHGVKVLNLEVIQTGANGLTWEGDSEGVYGGLRFEPPGVEDFIDDVVIDDVTVRNTAYGVTLHKARRAHIGRLHAEGFLEGNAALEQTINELGVFEVYPRSLNYNAALWIDYGEDVHVEHISGTKHGQLVLGGHVTVRPVIDYAYGYTLYDNGIYLSSAEDFRIGTAKITDIYSSAVKTRGSGRIGSVEGRACITVLTCSPYAGQDDAEIVVGEVIGTHRQLGFNFDDQNSTGDKFFRSISLGRAELTRDLTDGAGDPLPTAYTDYWQSTYASRIIGGDSTQGNVVQSANIGEIVVHAGDVSDLAAPGTATGDDPDQDDVVAFYAQFCDGLSVGKIDAFMDMGSVVGKTVVLNDCHGAVLGSVRGDGYKKQVALINAVGTSATLHLNGVPNSTAIEESLDCDETRIYGDIEDSGVSMLGSDSRSFATRAAGTGQVRSQLRLGRLNFFADGYAPNTSNSTIPANTFYGEGDRVWYNNHISDTDVEYWICVKEGYTWQFVYDAGTTYDLRDQIRGSDGNVYRFMRPESGETTIVGVDPVTDSEVHYDLLGAYSLFTPHYREERADFVAASTAATVSDLKDDVNSILTALKDAGKMATS